MAIVWVFILGFIMLGLVAGDSNSKRARERAYKASIKLSRHCEEYLAVWLTFFAYAFLEPDEHEDAYIDARKDVAALCNPSRYRYLSDEFWPPMKGSYNYPKRSFQPFMGPNTHFEGGMPLLLKIKKDDWLHVPKSDDLYTEICAMAKRYEELADLYDCWIGEYNKLSEKTKHKENPYQKINPHIAYTLDTYYFADNPNAHRSRNFGYEIWATSSRHHYYRSDPHRLLSFLSVNARNLNAAKDASIFDPNELVPPRAQKHYPEMRHMLQKYWAENNINPVSTLPETDLLGRQL